MKIIFERVRAKSTLQLVRGKSPLDHGLLQPSAASNSTTEDIARIEKISKIKPITNPSSN